MICGLLAACGADGAPFRPMGNLGLSLGSNGVSTSCTVGTTNGTVSVAVAC